MTGLLAELPWLQVGDMLKIMPALICTASEAAEYKLLYVCMKSIPNISIMRTMTQLLYIHTVAKHNRQRNWQTLIVSTVGSSR